MRARYPDRAFPARETRTTTSTPNLAHLIMIIRSLAINILRGTSGQ
jgi:hypothetical protein